MAVSSERWVSPDDVISWASQLAGEARGPDWLQYSYVVPDVVKNIASELVHLRRGLIGLAGAQGVGKSSALMALANGIPFALNKSRILFKWRREKDLYRTLLDNTHEASEQFMDSYIVALATQVKTRVDRMNPSDIERCRQFFERVYSKRFRPDLSDIMWAEEIVGKGVRILWSLP